MIAEGVISIALFIRVATTSNQPITALVPFAALSISVLVHIPFSVGFHLFNCISKEVRDLWCRYVLYVCMFLCVCYAKHMNCIIMIGHLV